MSTMKKIIGSQNHDYLGKSIKTKTVINGVSIHNYCFDVLRLIANFFDDTGDFI